KKDPAPETDDLKTMQGAWKSSLVNGGDKATGGKFVLQGDKYKLELDGFSVEGAVKLDPTARPKQIDLTLKNNFPKAIYKIEGDKMTLCVDVGGGPRPSEFRAQPDARQLLLECQRPKK